jgi:hypothetical protein
MITGLFGPSGHISRNLVIDAVLNQLQVAATTAVGILIYSKFL